MQTIVDIVFPLFDTKIYDRISFHATDCEKAANNQMYSKVFIRTAYLYALPLAIYNVEFIVDDLKLAFNIDENNVVEIKNELSELHEYLKVLYSQISPKVDYPERQERISSTALHEIEKRKRTATEAELPRPDAKRKLAR